MHSQIKIHGARQNNLKNLNVNINTQEITVITGVSGSGKSSLAFDTLYAEGQRKYVETFSPYARQFLDRMDKPQVDQIDGVLPAIAIDQTNPVRTSRSSVGTMTELNDHIKLMFAQWGQLYCRQCARPVHEDNVNSISQQLAQLAAQHHDPRLIITFPVVVPGNFTEKEVLQLLEQQGYTRIQSEESFVQDKVQGKRSKKEKMKRFYVIQDRFRLSKTEAERISEAIEAALKHGNGFCSVYALLDSDKTAEGTNSNLPDKNDSSNNKQQPLIWRFSKHLHCAHCNLTYQKATPSTFSFNSPIGACEQCRGFGRSMGIDYGLVIPDENKSLEEGCVKPWQTPKFIEIQHDLMRYAKQQGIRTTVPWKDLNQTEKEWLINGQSNWTGKSSSWKNQWYGAKRFFEWMESQSYKMHMRILLSKYRSFNECQTCRGSRLKADANLWRIGTGKLKDYAAGKYQRFMPVNADWSVDTLNDLPGLAIHDLMQLPIKHVREFFNQPCFKQDNNKAGDLVLTEIRHRLKYLCNVGLDYLSLDRQSRTLSGGEVQRINLTTALGTSLVNTLFVLDEPSIGLHPHDMDRIIMVMKRLRDAGNTLVVVEHDPQVITSADRILEIGPGPGERGGHIVFDGTPDQLRKAPTLTGKYLGNILKVQAPLPMKVTNKTPRLLLEGVNANNLKNCDVAFPLGRLVCVSGVSGSGKSTLIQDVLYPALLKHFSKPTEAPGTYSHLLGAEQLADVVIVDQSPIGKTTRSNPASYVGAFESIRKLFAQAPLSLERGYKPGTFSFNSGDGRCPTCSGTGFEHIEMQFLSDVYLRCPDCNGKRFRPEICEVKVEHLGHAASIDEVLEMTVSQASEFFKGLRDVQTNLQPLLDVGLEYITLGQPVPTLSGGEAQRLKLAGHLAEAARNGARRNGMANKLALKGTLFLLDEPTTGLHFDDVARLMQAFRKLLAAGHSIIIIEHNLDLIRAADWVIDLGPEGGENGGQVIAQCTPADLQSVPQSHTGQALLDYETYVTSKSHAKSHTLNQRDAATTEKYKLDDAADEISLQEAYARSKNEIKILNAKENNLKGINVDIPRDCFTVITGVSGSGKSTLAFDILFNEGQRRYLESLNAYARSVVQPAGKPDVDAIYGIAPTVAIEQRTSRGGYKSTVGTMTEIHHFLRLLYVKLGTQYCPDCHVAVEPQAPEQILAHIMKHHKNQEILILAPLITARKGYYTDLAKWAANKGYTHLRCDGELIPVSPWPRLDRYKEHTIELPIATTIVKAAHENALRQSISSALQHGQGVLSILFTETTAKSKSISAKVSIKASTATTTDNDTVTTKSADSFNKFNNKVISQKQFSSKRACPICARSFPEPDPRLFSYNSKHGWCPTCYGTGLQLTDFDAEQTGEEKQWLNQEADTEQSTCPTCHGERLNEVARAVLWHDHPITEFNQFAVSQAQTFFAKLHLSKREQDIARDVLHEILGRLKFMQDVGLGYLTLNRSAPTLSGGEAQRIRLAAQLGSNLQGVCYVLDEPTIGLHPRDNRILLDALAHLEGNGNTLVVVEHDEDTIRRAQHIIDIGPGAGVRGGEVVAQGNYTDIIKNPYSLTGRYLARPMPHSLLPHRHIALDHPMIQVRQSHLHNLKSIDADFPLGRLTVVTGVSGSGKSTLARDVLLHNLKNALQQPTSHRKTTNADIQWVGCESIDGWQTLDRVLEVDQAPIGKTPRSCPATYIGFWDDIRKQFADTRDAKLQGWTASRFSFNTGDGRCPVCEGQGVRTVEMSFLPDVKVLCEACHGARFNPETLNIELLDKNIGEVLRLEVDDSIEYFAARHKVLRALQLLQDIGLGYLTLGQPSPTLSGGEAQRIKLVGELVKARLDEGLIKTGRASIRSHTLYVLDEPTVGLSMADVEKLITVLHRLVDAGNTVVVIEHNLDIMAEADWILDLGPEGGDQGGKLVAAGTPADLIKQAKSSHTGRILQEFMSKYL